MASLSILDWVIVAIIVFSIFQAMATGFFREFFALLGVIAGFLVAAWYYQRLAAWYAHYVSSPWRAEMFAFFTIFVVVVLLAGALGSLASWAVQKVGLRWFDRIVGAGFGVLRGALVSVIVVLALAAFAPQWGLQQSRFAPVLLTAGRGVVWAAPAPFRQRFWDGWSLLRTIPEHLPGKDSGSGSNH